MLDLARELGAHCLVVAGDHGSIILAMFLAGLVGSLTHCAGMCGPLVAAQSLERLAAMPIEKSQAWHRLTGGALIPYQLGRTTTYMMLGAILSLPVTASLDINWLAPILLWLAAAIFLLQGLQKLDAIPAGWGLSYGASFGFLQPMTQRLMQRPTGTRGYMLGILLGFLPCGLLYGALVAAAATGDPLAAAFAMLAFALGTFPLSWAIGYGSRFATQRFRTRLKVPLGLLMVFNAVLLAALSLQHL
ncbi:sulfite exporter TauE/SafE family protein [Dongia rigui]|uniref:Sulfite exporter TauE/SafE family protein n=1 Tax=Dongia rigui TaxID=940149 RepID=A0ABU5DUK5_9PROT|nr:sulfite exporter TauE/SafE family protein [Dongia rigui]MDY0870970.1 sulfite exporter TauE/SafE family protein [Dongia rigui]